MRKRRTYTRRQYWLVHTLCGILFCMFSFIYLYFYQGDVLAMAQHVLSEGTTSYNQIIGAAVITGVLLLIHIVTYSLLNLDRWLYAFTFFPSFFLLAVVSDVTPGNSSEVYNHFWLWAVPLVLILFAFIAHWLAELDSLSKDSKAGSLFSKTMWINVTLMLIMMFSVIGLANNDTSLHYRVKIENSILDGDYERAIELSEEYEDTCMSLTMLRAYSLSKTGQLPERLFEHSFQGGSRALFPNGKDIRALIIFNGDIVKDIHTRGIGEKSASVDYDLCALLADGKLKTFTKELSHYYHNDSLMPRHYKEALVLYSDKYKNKTNVLSDSLMNRSYEQFRTVCRKHNDRNERIKALNEKFADTYWYYYERRFVK